MMKPFCLHLTGKSLCVLLPFAPLLELVIAVPLQPDSGQCNLKKYRGDPVSRDTRQEDKINKLG
jgi:hypothetical protein